MEVREKARICIEEFVGKAVPEISDDHPLREYLVDSLELVEFILTLEDEFGIIIPDSVVAKINTFGEVVQAVQQLIEAK